MESIKSTSFPTLVSVEAHPDYHVYLRYSDGTEGDVDLSSYVGKGVFSAWRDESCFKHVRIGTHSVLVWDEEIEMCGDALYLKLSNRSAEEMFRGPESMIGNA